MFENIPSELKALKRWVSVDIEPNPNPEGKPIKVPYVSLNGRKASTTAPDTWHTFEDALSDVTTGKRDHIGFVLSPEDPYVFVDLDDLTDPDQQKVYERFNTYSQRSVSGKGIHLICRGSFAGAGKHPTKPHAGLFQENRYILMTGDVVEDRHTIEDVATADLQSIHDWLSTSKEYPSTALQEIDSNISDDEVFIRGCKRFHRFESLTEGEWEQYDDYNNDHSKADHALFSMLCDLTPSNEQVRNLFSRTKMWSPEREAKKKGLVRYADATIKKIRSKQVYFAEKTQHITLDFEKPAPPEVHGSRAMIDSLPDGLIKRIADWGFRRSEYPLQEAALAAAFTIISTVGGRNYQTYTRSGLNTWIVLLAGTGTGKNEYQNIIGSVVKNVSDANKFGGSFMRMFSGELASGQAVEDVMATRNRCMCYFPEFDDIYHNLTAQGAAPHFRSLKKAVLNAYMMSGRDGYLSRRLKARQKGEDAPDETPIQSPLLILAGECTPEAFYKELSFQEISRGFLQRFSVLQAKKESTSRRPSPEAGMPMPQDLIDDLLEFFVRCDELEASGEFVTVAPSPEAFKLLQQYRNDKKDLSLAEGVDEASKQFYTRAGLKVIRYASQFAISDNWQEPIIQPYHVEWAVAWVDEMDSDILNHFRTGNVGTGQTKQENDIAAVFTTFSKMSTAKRIKAGISPLVAAEKNLLPHLFLKKKVIMMPSFAEAQVGAVSAFEKCLSHMAASGQLLRIDSATGRDTYKEANVWSSL